MTTEERDHPPERGKRRDSREQHGLPERAGRSDPSDSGSPGFDPSRSDPADSGPARDDGPVEESDAPGRPAKSEPPRRPDLPAYIVEPLERQSVERLDVIAGYARRLAAYKRAHGDPAEGNRGRGQGQGRGRGRRKDKPIDDEERSALEQQGISTDPADYETVPEHAYVTIKETKPGYRYYYWQWREGPDSWANEYIAPVTSPRE